MVSSIILIALFIGVLITFHEFGHLIVAKISRIPVEVFSIGFGPIILKHKWDETEYRLALIPLGGFIKMAGEEDQVKGGFSDKPLGIKTAVIAAGPFFNLVLGFLMLTAMFLVFGLKYTAPVVNPAPGSSATAIGLQPGDLLVSAAAETIPSFDTFEKVLGNNAGEEIEMTVMRNGKLLTRTYAVPADTWYTDSIILPVISKVKQGSPAAQIGLKQGDTLISIANTQIRTWNDFTRIVRSNGGEKIAIGWHRTGELFTDSITPVMETDKFTGEKIGQIGVWIEQPRRDIEPFISPVVGRVRKRGPAARLGLKSGDTIISVADIHVRRWNEFTRIVNARSNQKIPIAWRRAGKLFTDSITPTTETDQLTGEKVGQIGVWVGLPTKKLPFHTALYEGLNRTGYVVVQTFVILYKVITHQITTKAIGGPVFIAKVAYEGASWGAEYFLALWALLSINLFVVNMLPIPVLDGGHIVLFLFEAIRRRRLTEKEMAWAMNIGWLLIGAIFVFTLLNDVLRLITK